jgi:hypothetical protein
VTVGNGCERLTVSKADPLAPLLSALRDLAAWLRTGRYRGIVIGGVAASLLGRPRITRDVDALVLLDESRWAEFVAAGARYGFVPRIPNWLGFAHKARVLLLRHDPSQIETDISVGALPFEEEAVARAQFREVRGIALPLPSPEDLVIMKTVAHRARDLADIAGIVDAHPKLDWRRVRRWVRDFAAALEMPNLPAELEKLLPNRRKKKKGKRPT